MAFMGPVFHYTIKTCLKNRVCKAGIFKGCQGIVKSEQITKVDKMKTV